MGAPANVIESLDRGLGAAIEDLAALARIPSVSARGFDAAHVAASAQATAELFAKSGLEGIEVLTLPDAHPYVVADWLRAGPDVPTVLVYAHHDVQPPGRAAYWQSPPFEPTRRGDGRLYGRGVVDDKAGVLLHLAAQRAWLDATGSLPVNVKWIVEGEEETGSEHLAAFLRAHRARLDCDVLVLSDTANLATGVPSLTTSLRGIVVVDVTVRALDHPIHSGMWGGPVPDAATAMTSLLARLVDDRGAIAVPGLYDDARELSAEERNALAALPFDAAAFRRDAGMAAGTAFIGERDRTVYERLWHRPSLALTALEGMPIATAANQLMAEARARIGVRVAAGQDARRIADLVEAFVRRDPPAGVRVETAVPTAVPGWKTRADGPAFDAARRALRAGYGRDAVAIGCGGSIPFVGPFVEVLGGVPALLLGLEDPPCNAHGENESLDLTDFRKAAHSSAHLLAELRGALL
ncbi:MAG TPA: M20/M25/M40 family metallo-hydrolase [Myxococcota bacterium]|nr:M20/M25/M40 family metallo-hydrolase [Myxococcota bacterium]